MHGLDAWLEAPYVNAARDADAYEDWCEREDLDSSEDHWDAFEDAMAAEYEGRMEDAAEARMDRMREDW